MGEVPWDSSSPTPNSSTDKPRGRGLENSLLHSLSLFHSFYLLASQPLSDRLTLLTIFTLFCVFAFSFSVFNWPDSAPSAQALSMPLFLSESRSLTFTHSCPFRGPSLHCSIPNMLSISLSFCRKIMKIYWTKQCIRECLRQTDVWTYVSHFIWCDDHALFIVSPWKLKGNP